MDLEKISLLCENLNLDDRDVLMVSMDSMAFARGVERMNQCMVGKVLGNKVANQDGLESAIRVAWKISKKRWTN